MRVGVTRLLLALLLGVGTNLGLPATAQAAPRPQTATCAGVWVVVDYGSLGGQSTACASSFSTGLAAMRAAGFAVTLDAGMVVKINALPTTPDIQTAYWSYWHATLQADGSYSSWSYASTGPAAYHPTAGNAEGWRYESVSGGQLAPRATPPKQVVAPPPAATTTAAAPRTTATRTTTQAAQTTAAATTPVDAPTPPATPSPTPTPSATTSATPDPSSAQTPGPTPGPTTAAPSLNGLYGGIGAILAVGLGAGATALWRRRVSRRP